MKRFEPPEIVCRNTARGYLNSLSYSVFSRDSDDSEATGDALSRIHLGAPVRNEFIKSSNGQHPMAELLSSSRPGKGGGGRGGRTRIALYLSALWIIRKEPYTSTRVAPWWASLIGLCSSEEESKTAGARSVRDSWLELERRGFCLRMGDTKTSPTIKLMREDGRYRPYTSPTSLKVSATDRYFRMPETFWTRGLVANPLMDGSALTMYLTALYFQARFNSEVIFFPSDVVKSEIGIGDTTRKRGLRNLEEIGVLVRQESDPYYLFSGKQGRRRNFYKFGREWAPRAAEV